MVPLLYCMAVVVDLRILKVIIISYEVKRIALIVSFLQDQFLLY